MNAVNDPLWQALDALEWDQPGAALTFSQRLARERRSRRLRLPPR
jgi:hypothetical protein